MTQEEIGFLKEELERVKNDHCNLLDENSRLKKDLNSKAASEDLERLKIKNTELRELHDSTVKLKDDEIKQLKKDAKKKKGDGLNEKADATRARNELDLIKKVISSKDSELTDEKARVKKLETKTKVQDVRIVALEEVNEKMCNEKETKTATKTTQKTINKLEIQLADLEKKDQTRVDELNEKIKRLEGTVENRLLEINTLVVGEQMLSKQNKKLQEQADKGGLAINALELLRDKFEGFLLEDTKAQPGRQSRVEKGLRELLTTKDQKIEDLETITQLLKTKLKEVVDKLKALKGNGSADIQKELDSAKQKIQHFTHQLYTKAEEVKVLRGKHLQAAKFCSEVSKGITDPPAKTKFKEVARFCSDVAEAKLDLNPAKDSNPGGKGNVVDHPAA